MRLDFRSCTPRPLSDKSNPQQRSLQRRAREKKLQNLYGNILRKDAHLCLIPHYG